MSYSPVSPVKFAISLRSGACVHALGIAALPHLERRIHIDFEERKRRVMFDGPAPRALPVGGAWRDERRDRDDA